MEKKVKVQVHAKHALHQQTGGGGYLFKDYIGFLPDAH